jgi:hypothetical protein
MSIQYLNLKTENLVNFGKAIMRKVGRDFLLVGANSEQVNKFKTDFGESFNKGVVELVAYLLEASKDKFQGNEHSKPGSH